MTDRPILTPLAAELRRAVRRQRRRRHLARAAALAVVAGLFGSGTAGALALTGVLGSEPSRPYGVEPPEPNLRYAKRPVVLARGERGPGTSFEVPEGTGHGCLSPTESFQGSSGLPGAGATPSEAQRRWT